MINIEIKDIGNTMSVEKKNNDNNKLPRYRANKVLLHNDLMVKVSSL